VYVLYNKKASRTYIGQTANLQSRIDSHNSKKGNHFTARYEGEWELIYQESAATRSDAIIREKQLKSHQGREFLKQYIPE